MLYETKNTYFKLAANFYKNQLGGQIPTQKKIADALHKVAANYRPNYWRRLRSAIACDQREKGFDDCADFVSKLVNPIGNKDMIVKKQKRVKSISEEDYRTLLLAAADLKGPCVCAMALLMTYELGCRPAELLTLKVISETEVFICGAKKTKDRGADRIVVLPAETVNKIKMGSDLLRLAGVKEMKTIQNKLWRLAKMIWPQRKHIPTLYSLRHQMGSDLKAKVANGEITIAEVAYIMGHQSAESCSVYGDRRMGARNVSIKPSSSADLLLIRKNERTISANLSI